MNKKTTTAKRTTVRKSNKISPWQNEEEPEAPYHPLAKLQILQVKPKSFNQKAYLEAIDSFDMVFGIGPAGSGKTVLAVAKAVQWLSKKGNKLVITRPVVEAGEKLGYLPGDFSEKIAPYLLPIKSALVEFMGPQMVDKYIEMGIIEVAPLAYLRGRTFNDSFVILDEAQNATDKQTYLFLTRMGKNSKLVINGDPDQIDLPSFQKSGLEDAQTTLSRIKGIKFCTFDSSDIVRHPLVQEVVDAYKNKSYYQA